jgi:outer membrane protein assembly factor BamB
MRALALAVALGAIPGLRTTVPPAPVRLWTVAWAKKMVAPAMLEWNPVEPGAPAVDPVTGVVVVGTRDGWLRALRPDGSTLWDFHASGAFAAQPRIDGDVVFAGCDDGRLYAIVLATGVQKWRYDAGEELGTRPAIANGTLYVASLQDTVFAVDARTGAWKWHRRRENAREGFTIRGAASVSVAGGLVFAGYSDGSVVALDPATGATRWERAVAPAGQQLDVDSVQADGGKVFAAAYSGAVVALDAATGKPAWQWSGKDASRVAVARGTVVAVTTSQIVGLSAVDGTPMWTAPLEGVPGGEPVISGKWALVPAGSGGLRVLELASGRTLRVLQPGSGVSASPALAGSRAYVLSNAGQLLALDLR